MAALEARFEGEKLKCSDVTSALSRLMQIIVTLKHQYLIHFIFLF